MGGWSEGQREGRGQCEGERVESRGLEGLCGPGAHTLLKCREARFELSISARDSAEHNREVVTTMPAHPKSFGLVAQVAHDDRVAERPAGHELGELGRIKLTHVDALRRHSTLVLRAGELERVWTDAAATCELREGLE